MKLRMADPVIAIAIGVVMAVCLPPLSGLRAPPTLAEKIDAMTGPGFICTEVNKQLICYSWLLTVTDAHGQPRDFGYFRSEAECKEILPQVEAERQATNGHCTKPRLSLPGPFDLWKRSSPRCQLPEVPDKVCL